MPPANSPSDTRPSTPPSYALATASTSLSSHPYLQQLEEAISTPVPDLASTLATPESRPPSDHRRLPSATSPTWHGRPGHLHLSHTDNVGSSRTQLVVDRAGNNEDIARMQSELDRWQEERNRLRSILHHQQTRQSVLEEQNYQLREQRSRLQEEHDRLHEQSTRSTPPSSRIPDQLPDTHEVYRALRESRNNISNLAGAISEVGRDSYSTTGAAPSRQRLYDWAAARPHADVSVEADSARAAEGTGDVDSAPRRELDRALRNYRMARTAFRSGRHPGSDLGAVPTASALRAYWNEEPNEPSSTQRTEEPAISRPPFALSEFVEQHRFERHRRHLEVIRRQSEQIQHEHQPHPARIRTTRSDLMVTDTFIRVRNTIKYLSALRYAHSRNSLELARCYGLDSLHQYDDTTAPSQLPLHIDTLPLPQPSSWLTPGLTWHGLQSTDREPIRPTMPSRRQRRENLGISMARSRLAETRSSYSLLSDFTPSTQPLDTDRYISSLMQDSEGRWGFNDESEPPPSSLDPLAVHQPFSNSPLTSHAQDVDHWPVTVSLHSVDFDSMTVSGTMQASQLPDKIVSMPLPEPRQESDGSTQTQSHDLRSMESFFIGEIIDFRRHTLETEGTKQKSPYRSGGIDVDARYWARLGPFKREIERYTSSYSEVNGKVWDIKLKEGSKYLDSESLETAGVSGAREDAKEEEADEVMARCLSDGKWLEEKLGSRGGEWILMRWKEQCFVDPILSSTSSTSSPSPSPHSHSTERQPHSSSQRRIFPSSDSTTWGLTISGFYYIALNRLTGEIDGLYFDLGSQPFQTLSMVPSSHSSLKRGSAGDVEGMEKVLGMDGARSDNSRSANADVRELLLRQGLGVRRSWAAVEFR